MSGPAVPYAISFAAVQEHVAVLHRARLVRKQRQGREQRVTAEADGLRRAQRVLDDLDTAWRGRVNRIDHLRAAG